MYRIPGAYSRKTTTSATAVPPVRPTRDPLPGSLNDVVVRRLLTAGEDLQAALGLMVNHPANGKIRHAVDELDQAIREIRGTTIDHPAGEPPPLDTSTSTA
jgi:hypothetical protein